MTTKRDTKKIVAGVTAEQYREAMSGYARTDSRSEKLAAQMSADMIRIQEKYAPELMALNAEKERQGSIIQSYCIEHKQELFTIRRRVFNDYGSVGFRLGTPKLKTLPNWTWDNVLDRVKTTLPGFVRTYEEVDREGLIACRNHENVAPCLQDIGVYIAQDESFYIELKKEKTTQNTTPPNLPADRQVTKTKHQIPNPNTCMPAA